MGSLAQSLPGQQRTVAEHAALVAELFTTNVTTPNAVDPHYWFERLDRVGAPAVCEMIARGAMHADIAMSLTMPLTLFAEWCENNISGTDLARALRMHAQVCVMKGRILLATPGLTPSEAGQAKILADRLFTHAERIDRIGWSPSAKEITTPAPVTVNLTLPGYGNPTQLTSTYDASPARPAANPFALPVVVDVTPLPGRLPIPPLLQTQGRRMNTPPIRV